MLQLKKGLSWNVFYQAKKKKKKSRFPVAHAHCVLTIPNDKLCVFTKHLSAEKHATKRFFDMNMMKTSVEFI